MRLRVNIRHRNTFNTIFQDADAVATGSWRRGSDHVAAVFIRQPELRLPRYVTLHRRQLPSEGVRLPHRVPHLHRLRQPTAELKNISL